VEKTPKLAMNCVAVRNSISLYIHFLLQTLCAIEAQLEYLLGSFRCTMAGEFQLLIVHKHV